MPAVLPDAKKRFPWRPAAGILLLAAAVAVLRLSGGERYLQPELLRPLLARHPVLAPFLYLLAYTLAAVLFVPGLPLTVAAGILFGPFWGVVYAITGATLGACAAFLAGRYLAADWVRGRLSGSRWEKLYADVEKNGWKVVAVTRLVPLFPFNLLNYAFGLTPIRFLQYLLPTFFCMLPACIAYVVFSTSLLELLAGSVSPSMLVGIALVAAVSAIPRLYRRIRQR